MKVSDVQDPDLFCFYCQQQLSSPGRFKRHLHTRHLGTYAQRNLAPLPDDEPREAS